MRVVENSTAECNIHIMYMAITARIIVLGVNTFMCQKSVKLSTRCQRGVIFVRDPRKTQNWKCVCTEPTYFLQYNTANRARTWKVAADT